MTYSLSIILKCNDENMGNDKEWLRSKGGTKDTKRAPLITRLRMTSSIGSPTHESCQPIWIISKSRKKES